MENLVEVKDLEVRYAGAVQALRGVDVTVPSGAVVAVLGSNGAGKSTLLRAITRSLHPHGGAVTAGSIQFLGQDTASTHTAGLVRAGMAMVPEGRQIFRDMTVDDNLRAGGCTVRDAATRREAYARVMDLFPVLADRRQQSGGLLSGGQQQMLAIGRALMSDPKLLLLDEPSLGLSPLLVDQVGDIVRAIREQGTSVLLIEQNAAMGLRVADTAYVLEVGSVTAAGPASELADSDEIRRRYLGLGEEAQDAAPAPAPPARATVSTTGQRSAPRPSPGSLRIDSASVVFGGVAALADVSFEVEPGSIHALIGPNGAGKSTCINLISGVYRATSGSVRLGSATTSVLPAHRIAELGVVRTFQNISLSLGSTVEDNLMVGRHRLIRSGIVRDALRLPAQRREVERHREAVRQVAELLGIDRLLNSDIDTLSYGDRKRVELGRALAAEPTLLLLDEPVAGMAHGESQEMMSTIRDLHAELGISILLVEHDMPFVMGLAQTITVLDFGRRIAEGSPEAIQSDPAVIRAYLGSDAA